MDVFTLEKRLPVCLWTTLLEENVAYPTFLSGKKVWSFLFTISLNLFCADLYLLYVKWRKWWKSEGTQTDLQRRAHLILQGLWCFFFLYYVLFYFSRGREEGKGIPFIGKTRKEYPLFILLGDFCLDLKLVIYYHPDLQRRRRREDDIEESQQGRRRRNNQPVPAEETDR